MTYQTLLGSSYLNLSRFELRILKFFNDICIPFLTFEVNKRHDYVYKHVMPTYFTSSRLLRQTIFSFGCLGLWPFLELDVEANFANEFELLLLQERDVGGVSIVLQDPHIFDENEDSNVFRRTANYYSEVLAESRSILLELQSQQDSSQNQGPEKLTGLMLSSWLIFGFLACHPHRVVPLICFPEEDSHEVDVLELVSGMVNLSLGSLNTLRKSDIGDLFENDELAMITTSKVKIVDELRKQLYSYYHSIDFVDLGPQSVLEIQSLNHALDMLAKAIALSVKFNYPVALFRWLFTINVDFGQLARKKNPMALRILFVYSCLCLYCRFCLHYECIWRDYIKWFHDEHIPLSEFDNRIYHYVIIRDQKVINDKYHFLSKFDIWQNEFDIK